MRQLRRNTETDETYVELVAALHTAILPTSLMTVIFASAGIHYAQEEGNPLLWATTIVGTAFSLAKVVLALAFRRRDPKRLSRRVAALWERCFAVASIGFGFSLGALTAQGLMHLETAHHTIGIVLLFGYCSGVVARLYVRPWICASSITAAAAPAILVSALDNRPEFWATGILVAGFLLGGIESVRHSYRALRQQIAARQTMSQLARIDILTGLPNRLALDDAIERLRDQGPSAHFAVHCFDLDGFKPVNDRYGHPTGDAVLRMVAERLRSIIRSSDTVARIGGDEFVIVQAPIYHDTEASLFARRIHRELAAPYEVAGQQIQIGASIGYALSSSEAKVCDLIRLADAALYQVKKNGSGGGVAAAENGDGRSADDEVSLSDSLHGDHSALRRS